MSHGLLVCSAFAVLLLVHPAAPHAQQFSRITDGPHVHTGGNSWGISWIDYDLDGYEDLFIVANKSGFFQRRCLFHNNGDGTFTEITTGVLGTDPSLIGGGCTWGDYDNDGDPDLVVANWDMRNNLFYRNNGGGAFEKITSGIIANDPGYSIDPAWLDIDNDGDLDLYIANHGNPEPPVVPGYNYLYRNDGGTFVKITNDPSVLDDDGSNNAAPADYDNDGDIDIFVANFFHGMDNRLYRNNGDGTFAKVAGGHLTDNNSNCWGASWGDYDNDGHLDLFVTSSPLNFLYHNEGDGTFARVTGRHPAIEGGNSAGSIWGDFDNDGDLDLYVANGSYDAQCVNFMYINDGTGLFSRLFGEAIVADGGASLGLASCDYDRDGDLDIYVGNTLNLDEDNAFYRNNGNANHWIVITCVGTVGNRSAIGAKIRCRAVIGGAPVWQMRQIAGQTGNNGQNSLNAHFGLGDAAAIDTLKVEWTTGRIDIFTDVPADRYLTIAEPDSTSVGVQLRSFRIETLRDRVRFEFTVGGIGITDDLRLQGELGDASWPVPITRVSRERFTAVDFGPAGERRAPTIYRLYARADEGAWRLLHEEGASIETPIAALGDVEVYPNPFNPTATIAFRLASEEEVCVEVYDALGQLVTTLVNRRFPNGFHTVTWDGRGCTGRNSAAGVYFAHLTARKYGISKKLVLVR